jgi:hypothetical protein
MESCKEKKMYCGAFFKSSPVDEYHLPQMNSEKVAFNGSNSRIPKK